METFPDINPFNILSGNSRHASNINPENNGNGEESKPKIKFDPKETFYNMSGDKHMVIFNHDHYDNETLFYYNNPQTTREGTEEDVIRLEETFTKIGFTVDTHNNKDRATIWDILCALRETDYSAASCLCIVILTHGFTDGQLCAYDRPYNLKDVTKLFESHPTLAGKPKLFFVQACRGKNTDGGNRIAIDGEKKGKYFITPSHADFLVMRSTVEDYLSYRDCRGSWMIQELCKAIREYHEYLDLLHIITLVHQKVAYGYATYTPKRKATDNKRQMPEATFTLTKFLKF